MTVLRRLAPTAIKVALWGIIVYFVVWNIPLKLADLVSFLTHANAKFYVSMLVFSLFLMLQAAIWVLIVNAAGAGVAGRNRSVSNLRLLTGLRIFIDSQFAKYIPGGFWNYAGRVVLATRAGVALDAQFASIIYENVLLVSAALCYALILLVALNIAPIACIIGVLTVFVLAYVYYDKGSLWIRGVLVRVSRWKPLRKVMNKMSASFRLSDNEGRSEDSPPRGASLTRNQFFAYLICFLSSHFVMGIAFWLLTNSFGKGNIGLMYAAGTFATSWLLGLFSPLPGGLGVREGFLVYFLSLRLGAETALYISVIARIWNVMAEVFFWAVMRAMSYLTRKVKTYEET